MSNVLNVSRKAFTWSVVVLTIVWSVGLAALVSPLTAQAATNECAELSTGELFKVDTSSALYLVVDAGAGKLGRKAFPYNWVYFTWYPDYSNIVVTKFASGCVDAFENLGFVNPRPGSVLVKSTVSPNVFAIGPGNMKHKVPSEAVASSLYGSTWNKGGITRDYADVFDASLKVGSEVTEAPHNGQLVKKSDSADVYYAMDGKLSKVSGSLPAFVSVDVRTVSAATFAKLEMASGTATPAKVTENPSQGVVVVPPTSPTSTAPTGQLKVSLAADTPAGGIVADGTAYNQMLKVNLEATGGTVKVTGVTVTKQGLIANTSITGVSVWDKAGVRHGNVITAVSSDNKITVGFGSNPILVPAGSMDSLTVTFDIASTTNSGTVGASIMSAADVTTDGTITGTFPIVGNDKSIQDGSASLANATIEGQSVGGTTTGGTGNSEIGETKEIGKFKITQSNGKNDLSVESMTFYLEGSIDDNDLKDFKLYAPDNTLLGTTEWAKDRYVTVALSPTYTVPKSSNRVLTLKATVVDGSGHEVRVHVQNDYDVKMKDASLLYYILPTGPDVTGGASAYFVIKAGSVLLTKKSDSPTGTVPPGTSDVLLAKFDVKAVGEDIEIRKMGIRIATTGATMDLTGNIKLVADGVTLLTFSADDDGSLYHPVSSGGPQKTLSQYLTIKSGLTKVLEVYGNTDSSATSTGYTVNIGNFYMKRLASLDFVDNKPASTIDVSANAVTVSATSLSFNKDTTVGSKNISNSATQVLAQFVATAGGSEDVTLTNLSCTNGGTISAPLDLQNLYLKGEMTGATSTVDLGSTVGSVATSSNSFSFNYLIPKSKTLVVKVYAYVDADASGTAIFACTPTYIGKSSNNSTTGSSTTGQTMTIASANVIISATTDSSTISGIRVPSATAKQVGKWKYESQNEKTIVDRITFELHRPDATVDTASGEFGTLYLYDAADMTTPLDDATYIAGSDNGYARFEKSGLFTVDADKTKYLVLMSTINPSGTMNPATTSAWAIATTTATNMTILKSSGGQITTTAIDVSSNGAVVSGDADTWATSTFYLYHNSAPTITNVSVGTTLEIGTQTPIFKYTVTNNGDRELRVGTTTINVSASGLVAAGASGTGTLHSFKLWEANAGGGLGTQLATSTMGLNYTGTTVTPNYNSPGVARAACLAGGTTGGPEGATTGPDNSINCTGAATSSLNLVIGQNSDLNGLFDSLTVPVGGSRTFILTADTSDVLDQKTTGTVSVTAKLSPSASIATNPGTGKVARSTAGTISDSINEADWANGVLFYFYTPSNGGSENTTAYSASDTYDVTGNTLTKTL